jgi:hypothetical protein
MSESLDRRVRERAKNRYEYCKIPAYISEFTFPLDHIIAQQHAAWPGIELPGQRGCSRRRRYC